MDNPTPGETRRPGGFRFISDDEVEIDEDPEVIEALLDKLSYFVEYIDEDLDSNKDYIQTVLGLKDKMAGILLYEPALSSSSMGILRRSSPDSSGRSYSVCKVLYSDPSSWRKGTVDGVIFGHGEDMTFLYSIVYERGEFIGFQVYPCLPDQSFDELVAAIKKGTTSVEEATKVICIDRMDQEAMTLMFGEDVESMPDKARGNILGELETCFGIKVDA